MPYEFKKVVLGPDVLLYVVYGASRNAYLAAKIYRGEEKILEFSK